MVSLPTAYPLLRRQEAHERARRYFSLSLQLLYSTLRWSAEKVHPPSKKKVTTPSYREVLFSLQSLRDGVSPNSRIW
jgi:hypothetical protein